MSFEQIIGGGLIALAVLLCLVFGFMRNRMAKLPLRDLPVLTNLKQSVGLTIEDGKRLHVSLGNSSVLGSGNAASLAGLSMIEHLALLSMISDRPPVVTTGDGTLMILGQDVVRYVYRHGNILNKYDPQLIRQTGFSPFSYAMGTMPVIGQENVQTSVLIGRFGVEAALIHQAALAKNGYSLGASDDLTAQAVMLGTASDTLIGEELFAAPAYLSQSSTQRASLFTQDVLRWVIILTMIAGVLFVILNQFFGFTFL